MEQPPNPPEEIDNMTTTDQFHRLEGMVGSLAVTVDKLTGNVDRMMDDSAQSRAAMEKNTVALQRSKRQNTLLRVALAACLAIFIGGGVVVWRDHDQSACIKKWAVATGARSNAVTGPSADRVTDLYGALGAAAGGHLKGIVPLPSHAAQIDFIYSARGRYPLLANGTKADLSKLSPAALSTSYYLVIGLDANNTYVDEAAGHPVPSTPFNCSSF